MLHDIGHYPLSHNIEAAYKEGVKEKQNRRKTVIECQEDLVGCPNYLATDGDIFCSEINDIWAEDRNKYLRNFAGSSGYHHENIGAQIIENNRELHDEIREHFITMRVGTDVVINPFFKPRNVDDPAATCDPDQITDKLMHMIAAMVIGNYEYKAISSSVSRGDSATQILEYPFEEKYSAMVQLIHSELDADNMDYLLRDATFSGTSYGLMDVSVLLNCLTVSEIEVYDEGGEGSSIRYIVGVLPKGIGCVEQFLTNKYMAYSQMIFSKYTSSLEAMLLNWAKHELPNNKIYGIKGKEHDKKEGEGEQDDLFMSIVRNKKTLPQFLHFTDAFIFQCIYENFNNLKQIEESRAGKLNPVRLAMVSRLVNYTSFELEKNAECKCVGLGESEIREQMLKEPLYQDYKHLIQKIGSDMTVEKLNSLSCEADGGEFEKQLLSFRFESYSLTKQLPIKQFHERIAPSGFDQLALRHYYRLANGIPIIPSGEENKYRIILNDAKEVNDNEIPLLIVDSPASSLRNTWSQKFVFLRKYKLDPMMPDLG